MNKTLGPTPTSQISALQAVGYLTLHAFDALFPLVPEPVPVKPVPIPLPKAAPKVEPVSPKVYEPPPIVGFLVGWNYSYLSQWEPVCATDEELDRHVLLIGGTGCGKTTLMTRLFMHSVFEEAQHA